MIKNLKDISNQRITSSKRLKLANGATWKSKNFYENGEFQ